MSSKRNRSTVADADALGQFQAAEARALLEQSLRHQREAEADRRENARIIEQFKQELARDRLEIQALETQPVVPVPVQDFRPAPLRDEHTGRPAAEPAPDPATMSLEEYTAWRQADGQRMDGLGIEATGRTGRHLSDESGFPDWRSASSGSRVYEGQLRR